MRKVEFLEDVKLGRVQFVAGDVKSFSDTEAAEYIRLGWAKCSETGETGERVAGSQPLAVDSIISNLS